MQNILALDGKICKYEQESSNKLIMIRLRLANIYFSYKHFRKLLYNRLKRFQPNPTLLRPQAPTPTVSSPVLFSPVHACTSPVLHPCQVSDLRFSHGAPLNLHSFHSFHPHTYSSSLLDIPKGDIPSMQFHHLLGLPQLLHHLPCGIQTPGVLFHQSLG